MTLTNKAERTAALLTFHHFSFGIRLARLDDLVSSGEKLEAVRLVAVGHISHLDDTNDT